MICRNLETNANKENNILNKFKMGDLINCPSCSLVGMQTSHYL